MGGWHTLEVPLSKNNEQIETTPEIPNYDSGHNLGDRVTKLFKLFSCQSEQRNEELNQNRKFWERNDQQI